MRLLLIPALAGIFVLAGCGAIPLGEQIPQDEPAPVMLVNNATQTETFTVGVVQEGAFVNATRSNNQTANYRIGQGSATIENPRTNPFTTVAFPESARIHGEYTLEPGEQKLLNITDIAPTEAIVITVFDEGDQTYRSIKSLSCSGSIAGYRVTSQAGGSADWTMSTHQCG